MATPDGSMTIGVTSSPNGGLWSVAYRDIAFLLLDGLRRPRPARAPDVALCALGLTGDGRAVPLAMRVETREDEGAWRGLLHDMAAAGLGPRLLLIGCDGHPALLRALAEVFPDVPVQISVPHRLLALARKVPAEARAACMAEARTIFSAGNAEEAVARFRDWRTRWGQVAARAVGSLEADLGLCMTFYRFPAPLWVKIRTVNLVERMFREARRLAPPAPVVAPPAPPEPPRLAPVPEDEGPGAPVGEDEIPGATAIPSAETLEAAARAGETVAETVEPPAPAPPAEARSLPTELPASSGSEESPAPVVPAFWYDVDLTRAARRVPASPARWVDALRESAELLLAYLWVIFLGLLVGAAAALVI